MKILILLVRWKGGVGRVVKSIKPLLEKKGHKVDIISREDNLRVYNFNPFVKLSINNIKDYDIIYTQDWSMCWNFMFKKNHYCCFHGNNPQKFGRFIQTIMGRIKGSKLFVVGDPLKKRFPKATVIYNGVNKKEFYDLKKPRKYFGWIDKESEIHTKEDMKLIAKNHNLDLLVAKDIPSNKMNDFYNKLKVFASYPSELAGFNLCWIEAIASGVPEVLGNEEGIGITKAKESFKQFTWENNVDKLLGVMK